VVKEEAKVHQSVTLQELLIQVEEGVLDQDFQLVVVKELQEDQV
jgi:hypothetical protein